MVAVIIPLAHLGIFVKLHINRLKAVSHRPNGNIFPDLYVLLMALGRENDYNDQ